MEVPMRQPPSPLEIMIAALPDAALRPLVLALLQNGAIANTPVEPVRAPRRARRPLTVIAGAKRRGGWPKGKPRGRGPGRPPKDPDAAAVDEKLLARRERAKLAARAKRAAAKAALAGNGQEQAKPEAKAPVTAAVFWRHAETLAPTKPWRIVARELGANEQLALDCHRNHTIPPGLTASAIERFLETSPS
jgi:hypothetical protein